MADEYSQRVFASQPIRKVTCLSYGENIQYLLKTTGRFLARVIDFLIFFVKCKTVKCNFRVFLSKKYKKKNG